MTNSTTFRRVVRAARLASEGIHPYDTSKPYFTDKQVEEWMDRNDWPSGHIRSARLAMEDAATIKRERL